MRLSMWGRKALAAVALMAAWTVTTAAEARHHRGEGGYVRNDGVHVKVNVAEQRMDVYVDGELQHRWRVSTGRSGFDTPGGVYRPQRLEREWYSKQYDGAPMPHAVFFNAGYAIHGTNDTRRLGRQASHGCVRLHPEHAEELYELVEEHGASRTRIEIAE